MGFEIRSLTSLVTIIYISIYPVESSLIMTIHNGIPLALAQIYDIVSNYLCVVSPYTLGKCYNLPGELGSMPATQLLLGAINRLLTTLYRNRQQHSVTFS